MAARTPVIYLHVGAMKTGTSYLQQLMVDNKDALLKQGVLFPGEHPRSTQVVAVRDVLGLRTDEEIRERVNGAWARLRAEMLAYEGRASVVSMEFLSFATRAKAAAVVRSLRGAEVHVILTVRDASRVIPAQWQETTQNRGTTSWPDYVAAILAGRDGKNVGWRAFQRAMDIMRMLDAWGAAVPEERLHVVLVPAPGAPPEELWTRFASVIGVDPASCTPPAAQRNTSLGYASADLMRRVNTGLKDLGMQSYSKTVKSYLCKQVLSGRTGEPKVTTDRVLSEFALDWNRTMTDAIASSGAHVVGEPDDLDVVPSQASGLSLPPEELVLDAARDAVLGLQNLIETRTTKLDAARLESPGVVEPAPGAPAVDLDSWNATDDPIDAAVADVIALVRHAVDLRARLRRADGKAEGDTTFPETPGTTDESAGLVDKVLRRMRTR